MNFRTPLFIVIVWMMGITVSSLAVIKRCEKNEKTILRHSVKTWHHTNHTSSSASDKSAVSCTGSLSLYCIKKEETVTFSSYSNIIIYTEFIIHPPLSGFKKQPYSPPRQFLNI